MSDCLRGHFLVATQGLKDSNFFKTVVLIIEHGEEGAMGLIVNRPSSMTIHSVLSQHFDIPETDDVAYVGGPVEPRALFIMHGSGELEDEAPIVPGLYCGSSTEAFESVVRAYANNEPGSSFRVFLGCSGWSPNQLEGEIARGDWHVMPARSELVLAEDPYNVWDECIRQIQISNRILPHTVRNPDWN